MESVIYDGEGWIVRGDFHPSESVNKAGLSPAPVVGTVMDAILSTIRFFYESFLARWKGRGFFINVAPAPLNPYYGVPCGGIGCGAIGRDFRGGFCKFSLLPGIVETSVEAIEANQFILSVRQTATPDMCIYQKALTCAFGRPKTLTSWDFVFPPDDVHYRGLYPRSWTLYDIPELQLKLLCRQVSSVIPRNYKDSCLPVCSFVWIVENNSSISYTLSLTFTFRNGTGNPSNQRSRCSSETFHDNHCTGIKLKHFLKNMDLRYGIAGKHTENVTISSAVFNPAGNGRDIWEPLKKDGCFDTKGSTGSSSEMGIALCMKFVIEPGAKQELEFSLAWDMPLIEFNGKKRKYKRRYTRFFPNTSDLAHSLCSYAIVSRPQWESMIEQWQNRVTRNPNLPKWYKSALFNELYYLTDGGTCWVEYDKTWLENEPHMNKCSSEQFSRFGRFFYLESFDYLMLNTYDVHFYASFSLFKNWPEIELSVQLDFADQLMTEDNRQVRDIFTGVSRQTKELGKIPHDLGNPNDEPWLETNAYMLSNTSQWKDLNMKFVLACYRDYKLIIVREIDVKTRKEILERFYELCSFIIKEAAEWDKDGDCLIENNGPDQAFDAWIMKGTSAYCASIWICALECCRRMAKELGKDEESNAYAEKVRRARNAYISKLWNGEFFKFDEQLKNETVVMADQLCGFWYLSTIDGFVNEEIMENEKINKALDTVYKMNVKAYAGGTCGPVNGIMLNGQVDRTSDQSEEVWGGVAYSLASFMILMGKRQQGFETAEGWYRSCWEKLGLQYQVPEALCNETMYRANGYMRPLAVWAIQHVLDMIEQKNAT